MTSTARAIVNGTRAHAGYCRRAATYWRDAALAEPSFVVVNPANGHAHYVYLLRGWICVDGADPSQLAAVRYYAAIERAYTRAMKDEGDAGWQPVAPLRLICRRCSPPGRVSQAGMGSAEQEEPRDEHDRIYRVPYAAHGQALRNH